MASYGQMQADLALLAMGQLLNTDFGALLNQAQREEVEAWPWSFLLTNYVLNAVAVQTAGTISVSTGSAIVTGVGTSFTQQANTQIFLHIGSSQVALPIASIQSGTQLTLSSAWTGAAVSGGSYNIITPVYSIVGFIEVYTVKQIVELTNVSREYINATDPARLAVGGNPSVAWAPAGFDSAGNIQIEIWEPPSSVLPYIVEGKLGPATMVNDSDQPQVPSAVLEYKAMYKACDALTANSGDARWATLSDKYERKYLTELEKAQTADQQRQNQRRIFNKRPSYGLDVISDHDLDPIR